ncbi:MAG: carbon-nitrogen hydrolase family protein [Rhodospirillaceae bacterium]|nr:carbon-nitrogen hydrolase family protein [Rhodospirillaceae bacterium]
MRLALFQNDCHPGDPAGQLGALARVARDWAGRADLLVTPELFMTGYRIGAEATRHLAEPASGPFADGVAALARETGMAILYGFPERDGARLYNSAQVFDGAGQPLALYRKIHLPNDEERAIFTPGDRIVTFDLLAFRVAPLICYDVEFPESVRACAAAGADLVLAPTALRQHWRQIAEMMMPVRALESGVYLAYCNQAGVEADWAYAGLSCICAPDGSVLARAGSGAEVIVATLERAAISAARSRLPYRQDGRFSLSGPN